MLANPAIMCGSEIYMLRGQNQKRLDTAQMRILDKGCVVNYVERLSME
jgi:hypothetical protein